MKSKFTLATISILFSVLLYSCGGNRIIPITGEDVSSPTDIAEADIVATPTPTNEPSPEATDPALSTEPPETLAYQTANASVKVDNAYLRDGPDIRFPGSAKYKKGDQFKVIGYYKDWFQVEARNGSRGWLYKDWLDLPSDVDRDRIRPIAAEELPPTPSTSQKECVPTYYDSCP